MTIKTCLLCFLVSVSLYIVSVENFVSLVAIGFTEELCVEFLNCAVFVRLTKIHLLVSE